MEGEAGWPGVRWDDRPTAAALLRPPSPAGGGGETGAGAGTRVERRGPSMTRVSSQLEFTYDTKISLLSI